MRRKHTTRRFLCMLSAIAWAEAPLLQAQGTGPSTEELQKQVQNPVSSLISVPFQNNINFPIGPYSRVQDVLNIQPVVPLTLTRDWNLITRWITPVVYQPDVYAGDGGANGLGDLNPSSFLSPANPGKVIWGFGPTFLLPTATYKTLGQGKWGAGPTFVVLTQPHPWTIGLLANNIWSFAGNKDREAVNQFLVQYFVNYNLKNGWYIGSQPILTANWRVNGENRWLVPFGWAVGKIVNVGKLPINAQLGVYYNLIHPKDLLYPKWQIRLQVALLFPRSK
ncbi:MAG TPA: hypothetical protein VG675_17775 [Bryobacteraceae bacterium]|nr:hypothetical protein [Bryobacteraceae bacterium]